LGKGLQKICRKRNLPPAVGPQQSSDALIMKAEVRGPFRITDDAGVDRTPKGAKERALLALVLMSPGQRRTRLWLQDKLWSTRSPEQGAVSFRQALANVRKALGPLSARLGSDRSAVWLQPQVLIQLSGGPAGADLLDDLDVDDPEFEDWLRDLRQQEAGSTPLPPPDAPMGAVGAKPVVAIVQRRVAETLKGQFLARALADRMAAQLRAIGDLTLVQDEGLQTEEASAEAEVVIEIDTLGEADTWYVLVRTMAQNGKRCVWTGRLRCVLDLGVIWDSVEVVEFTNRCVASAADLVAATGRQSVYATVHKAVRRIYDFDRVGLNAADMLLKGVTDSDLSGLALAWRGFVQLTAALEFRDDSAQLRHEAIEYCDIALTKARDNPVVLALASKVQMKLKGDFDYGHHLAKRAVAADRQNPYALDSLSQALFFGGDFQRGVEAAELARQAAAGMANGFTYDLLSCLAEMSVGRLDEARALALSCHRKMPAYRPALRYLVALNLLARREDEARHYSGRLRLLEPDFTPKLLLSRDYPVETLRKLGLDEALRGLIA
jgi:hypothetical protein